MTFSAMDKENNVYIHYKSGHKKPMSTSFISSLFPPVCGRGTEPGYEAK